MIDPAIRKRAENIVEKYKMLLDQTRVPSQIHIACEEDLVELIARALEEA
jgi:hypothetical protein